MDSIMIKCTKCGRLQPLKAFSVNKGGKHNKSSICKECRKKEWHDRTTEREELREKHGVSITHKKCNKCGQVLPLDQFWNDASTVDGKTKSCKNCKKEYGRKNYAENRELVLKRTGEYNKKNKEKIAKRKYNKNQKKRMRVLKHLSIGEPSCEVCGFSDDIRFLQIDHKQRDGVKERKKFKGANPFYYHILRMTQEEARKKYRVLCLLHNWADRYGITGEEYAIIKVKQ